MWSDAVFTPGSFNLNAPKMDKPVKLEGKITTEILSSPGDM